MIVYKFGEVVLLGFLQPNGVKKKRPALVILDVGDDDVVVSPITTRERSGDYRIKDWNKSGLLSESWIRLAKVSCLAKIDIDRVLGKVTNNDKRNIISSWKKLYNLK